MKIYNRKIYIADVLVVAISVATLLFFARYAQPLVIAPLSDFKTTNTSVLFSIERGSILLIDDSSTFSSPESFPLSDNLVLSLQPGVYFWKVEGIVDSPVRKMVIDSIVDLQIQENENGYNVFNTGTVPANVTFYANDTLIDSRVISIGRRAAGNGTYIEGREYGVYR